MYVEYYYARRRELTPRMYGRERRVPMKGSWRRKVITTGKKSLKRERERERGGLVIGGPRQQNTHPNKFKNPNVSTTMPTKGHLKNTNTIPPKKHNVPLIFCFLAKK